MKTILSIACLFCTLSPALFADTNTEDDTGLLVTSTRIQSDVEKLPASVTIITEEEIAASTARNVPELLKLESGINVRSLFGNSAVKETIDIRGFGATASQNTLILLDGRRLNDVDLSAIDYSNIPLHNVERIEITRGSAGSLYGDAAVGGVINIITKKHDNQDLSMSLRVMGGSYGTRQANASVAQNIDAFSYRVFINELSSDGFRDNNEIHQQNLSTNFRVATGDNEWNVSFNNDVQSLRLPGGRTVDPSVPVNELIDDPRGTSTPNDYADQKGNAYTAGYTRYFGDSAELIIDFGGRNKYQETFSDFGGGFSDYWESDLSTVMAIPRLRYHFGNHTGTIGYDYYQTTYDSDRTTNPANIDTPVHQISVDQASSAIYINHTSSLSESWVVNAGARQQSVKQKAEDVFDASAPGGAFDSGASPYSETYKEPMYDAGVRYIFDKRTSIFYNIARAVRFATVDELFEFDSGFQRTFSPLKPQTSLGHTLGIENQAKSDNFTFNSRISAYLMNLKNEIHFNPETFTNDNLDPTERSGVEVDLNAGWGKSIDLKLTYTRTRAVFTEGQYEGNDVPLVPTHAAGMSIIWRATNNLTFSISDNYVGRKRMDNDQNNIYQEIPEYEVVDVKAIGKVDGWIFEAAVYNLFDAKGYDYGVHSTNPVTPEKYNAYPLPGRTATFTLGKDF